MSNAYLCRALEPQAITRLTDVSLGNLYAFGDFALTLAGQAECLLRETIRTGHYPIEDLAGANEYNARTSPLLLTLFERVVEARYLPDTVSFNRVMDHDARWQTARSMIARYFVFTAQEGVSGNGPVGDREAWCRRVAFENEFNRLFDRASLGMVTLAGQPFASAHQAAIGAAFFTCCDLITLEAGTESMGVLRALPLLTNQSLSEVEAQIRLEAVRLETVAADRMAELTQPVLSQILAGFGAREVKSVKKIMDQLRSSPKAVLKTDLCVHRRTASRLCRRLEEAGWIETVGVPGSRQGIRATDAGRAVIIP